MSIEAIRELETLASVCPELNMSNYTEDDVRHLNDWAIEMSLLVEKFAAIQQPATGVPEDVVRDAKRYRELVRSGKYCPASLGTHWALSTCSTRPSTKAELDAPIDAAMLAAQAQKGEPV